jgi:phospholipid/cholesterol/gamma-HCH transport system substrate-binding protein
MKRRNEVIVGIFVVLTLAVAVVGTLWLARRGFGSTYPVHTSFDWGAGLKQGQQVLLAGVQVGTVENIELRPEGYLFVTMRIDEQYNVPRGTAATVQTTSFFGDKAVALIPSTPSAEAVPPGDTIPAGKPAPSIDELVTRLDSVGKSVSGITLALESELVGNGGIAELRKTIGATHRLVAQLGEIAQQQARVLSTTMASLSRTLSAVDSASVDSTVRSFRKTSDNLADLTANLEEASGKLSTMLAKLESGEGSAGKLLNDPSLYTDVRDLLTDVRALTTRVDSVTADFQKNPRRYINLQIF